MASKKDNTPKKLGEQLHEIVAATSKGPSIAEMVAEGERLLEQKTKPSAVPKKQSQTDNPYFQARIAVLKKMTEWHRNEIAQMEKSGDIQNRFYDQFIRDVAEAGDKLSS